MGRRLSKENSQARSSVNSQQWEGFSLQAGGHAEADETLLKHITQLLLERDAKRQTEMAARVAHLKSSAITHHKGAGPKAPDPDSSGIDDLHTAQATAIQTRRLASAPQYRDAEGTAGSPRLHRPDETDKEFWRRRATELERRNRQRREGFKGAMANKSPPANLAGPEYNQPLVYMPIIPHQGTSQYRIGTPNCMTLTVGTNASDVDNQDIGNASAW